MWLPLLAVAASAADTPSLYLSETLAVTGWPTGLLLNTVGQARTPILRSDSVLFATTYVGAGARVGWSPAHLEVGPRLSIKPVEVFDLHLEATHTSFYTEVYGLLPYTAAGQERAVDRKPRIDAGEATRGESWTLLANPTGYFAVGPIVGLSSWNFAYQDFRRPDGAEEPYVFDIYRGLVVAWEDVAIDHLSALLYQAAPGGDGPMLRLGPVLRGKWAGQSPDRSLQAGGVVMWKAGPKPSVPSVVAVVAPYVIDSDFLGGPPWFAVLASWDGDIPLGRLARAAP